MCTSFSKCVLSVLLATAILISGLPVLMPSAAVSAEGEVLHGDVTGDGIIDGRDALKIMRFVQGFETATADDIARGDVYPVPGTDGKVSGDGQLTADDASWILQYTVGLVTEGEVTGDFSNSVPVIYGIEPSHGVTGTEVIIYGESFIGNTPQENMVLFGDIPAAVSSGSSSELVVHVPEEAESCMLRVITPAGEAVSPIDFSVTCLRDGQLTVPEGMDYSDYGLVNKFGDEAEPGQDGSYQVPTDIHGVTVHSAVPKDSGEKFLFSIDLTDGTVPQPATMNYLSTAQALVFLAPYFSTMNPERAQKQMPYIKDDPKVAELAGVLETLYGETDTPFEDRRFIEAYNAAIDSVIGRMPDSLVMELQPVESANSAFEVLGYDLENTDYKVEETSQPLDYEQETGTEFVENWWWDEDPTEQGKEWQENKLHVYYPDGVYTGVGDSKNPGDIVPKITVNGLFEGWSPVDWYVRLSPVKNPYDQFVHGEQSIVAMDPTTILPREGEQQITFISSNSYTQYIDVFGRLFDLVWKGINYGIAEFAEEVGWDFIKGAASPDGDMHVPDDTDSVYIVRSFSGVLGSTFWVDESNFVWSLPEGVQDYLIAITFNALMAAIDTASIWIDVKTASGGGDDGLKLRNIVKKALKKGLRLAIKKIPKNASSVGKAELCKTILSIVNAMASDIACVVVGDLASAWLEKSVYQIVKIVGKSLDPLYKISVGSAAVERTITLVGLHRKVSPLETWVVTTGEPFTPKVSVITPAEGPPGEELTITGRNFDPRGAGLNEVRLGDYWQDAVKLQVISGNAEGTELTVKLPENTVYGEKKLFIKTVYSPGAVDTGKTFTVKRIPVLKSMKPCIGFAATTDVSGDNPFDYYSGDVIELKGIGFDESAWNVEDNLFFGNTPAMTKIESTTSTRVTLRVPVIAPGEHDVYFESTQGTVDDIRMPFTAIGAPTLSSVSPADVMTGQAVTLTGTNFGFNKSTVLVSVNGNTQGKVVSVNNTTLVFQMPGIGVPGDNLTVLVYTPAGTSGSKQVQLLPGVTAPTLPVLGVGYYISVNCLSGGDGPDGQVSVHDAMAFSRGDVDPFRDEGWDDRNVTIRVNWHEQEDGTFAEGTTEAPEYAEIADEGHEYKFVYYVYHYRNESSSEQLHETIDLDASAEDREEGDYVDYDYWAESPVGGANYKDYIFLERWDGVYESYDLVLGDQDEFYLADNATLRITGGNLVLGNGCKLEMGTLEGGGIVINGNRNYIEKAKLQNINGNGITINKDCLANGSYSNYYDQVFIENCTGHGIFINEASGNWMGAQISGAGGHGVYIKGGVQNTVACNISDCTGNGVLVEGGRNNKASGVITNCEYGVEAADTMVSTITPRVYNCRKSGIYVHGGEGHTMDDVWLVNNGGHGLELVNTALVNVEWWVFSINNTGDGIYLNNCSCCTFDSTYSMGNENGFNLQGPGTHSNTFRSPYTGFGGTFYLERTGAASSYWGNRKNGMYIHDGAHDNTFEGLHSFLNGENGLLISGKGCDRNEFEYAIVGINYGYVSELDDFLVGNRLDGIVITGGAGENSFKYCDIGKNDGNGLTISGEGTDFNSFEDCKFGCMIGEADNNNSQFKNKGYGILIQNGAKGTEVISCEIGINTAGGIRIENVTNSWAEGEERWPLVYLYYNWIGYGYTGVYYNNRKSLEGTSGYGIHISNSTDVYMEETHVIYHDKGIIIDGEGSGFNTVYNGLILYAGDEGILVEDSTGDYFNITSRYNGTNGITLKNTSDAVLEVFRTDHNTEDGMYLDNADNTQIKAIKTGPGSRRPCNSEYNGGSGLSIFNSENITTYYVDLMYNGAYGALVAGGSSNIEFIVPKIQQNGIDGLYINSTDNIRVFPDSNDTLSITRNSNHGVLIEDSTNVQIGRPNMDAATIANNGGKGIYIGGEATDGVIIRSVDYIGVNGEEAVAIIEGRNITIGGKQAGEGNSIEKSTTGILATGNVSGLYICNNNIGEPENWETGTREQGNGVGISLEDGISGVIIENNVINMNKFHGISISEGSNGNVITGNVITDNGEDGILITGAGTVDNAISQNSITRNLGKGIHLANGGNSMIEAPVITEITWRGYTIAGTVDAPKDSEVEVYADVYDQGEMFLGTSRIYGNNFYMNANVPEGKAFHAIVIYPDGNTSEFGDCQVTAEGSGAIAYTSTQDGNSEIYLLGSGRITPERLTGEPAADYSPRISSNPHYLAFVTERNGNPDIWTMETDGTNQVALVSDPASDYDPTWSFDNQNIAFVSERDGNPEIYAMNIIPGAPAGNIGYDTRGYEGWNAYVSSENDTSAVLFSSQPGLLTELQFYISDSPVEFRWVVLNVEDNSPGSVVLASGSSTPTETGWHTVDIDDIAVDSEFVVGIICNADLQPRLGVSDDWPIAYRSWLYFASDGTWNSDWGNYMIHATVVVDPQRVTTDGAVDSQPAWSPDGTKIAFTSDRTGNKDIWIMDADGVNPQQLTTNGAADYHPAWSPDGSTIVFASERDGNAEIYRIGVDGTNLVRLTENPATDTDPAWSHDGDMVVFSSDRDSGIEVYIMKPDGTKVRRKTSSLGDNTQPDAGRPLIEQNGQYQSYSENLLVLNPEDRINLKHARIQRIDASAIPGQVTYQPQESTIPVEYGTTTPYLVMESGNVTAAGTVNLTVWLYDAEVLGNLALEVHYDSLAFRLTNITGGDITDAYGSLYYTNPGEYPDYSGEIRFNWVCAGGYTGSGSVITLTFEVNEEAHWDDFDILLENMEAYDTALYLAGVTGIDGVLNIQGIYGDANHDGAINVLDMTRVARIVLEIDDRTQGSDANRDELINVLDITMIARKILGLD